MIYIYIYIYTFFLGHIFCHKCLSEALKYSNKKLCPLCRQPLVGNNAIHPIYMKV